ncbi:glycosyltransferase [Solihabitans fulvus]|nr:nucleotide disphospho-sugar-binding domain-containing protein [Solihabitans fulvus]
MTKVITAAPPLHGHTGPILAVTADLVRRGHEVVFVGGSRFARTVEAMGARFVALPTDADFDDRDLNAAFAGRAEAPAGPARVGYDLMHVFTDPMPGQYRALRELLAEFPAEVVIADTAFLGAQALTMALPKGGRPVVISVNAGAPSLPSVDTAPFGFALPPMPGEQGRARNAALNAEAEALGAPLALYAAEIFARAGVAWPDGSFVGILATSSDHYLQLSVPGFEYPRSDAPASFQLIGALPSPGGDDAELPAWWADVTRGDRPVVVVTQGTAANDDLSELIVPTMQALAGRDDLLVVAATARPDGPDLLVGAVGELPGNARAGSYLPFERLLPHADLLVTNGGYGGVHTALRHGVPLVVAGGSEDKPEVAARVQWSGTGIDLRTGTPGAAEIAAAVAKVLDDPAYRERAGELAVTLAEYRPLDTIAGLVDGRHPQARQ